MAATALFHTHGTELPIALMTSFDKRQTKTSYSYQLTLITIKQLVLQMGEILLLLG